mmetsp:Transcript_27699/g.92038  ORF Transcript_27699/g.92038 Transcript_27699/m.92038 type:complete len:519 (-) Transcript_27699:45-1601(-)
MSTTSTRHQLYLILSPHTPPWPRWRPSARARGDEIVAAVAEAALPKSMQWLRGGAVGGAPADEELAGAAVAATSSVAPLLGPPTAATSSTAPPLAGHCDARSMSATPDALGGALAGAAPDVAPSLGSDSRRWKRPEDRPERVPIPQGSRPAGSTVVDTEVCIVGAEACIGAQVPSTWDCFLKKERRRKMTRVGYGRGEYVLDMEFMPVKNGVGQWDMSYRYSGPCQGQYVLVEEQPEEDFLTRLGPHLRFVYAGTICLAMLLGLFVAWVASEPGAGGPTATAQLVQTAKAVVQTTTTMSTSTSTLTTATSTSTTSTTIFNLPSFEDYVRRTYRSSQAAWSELAENRRSALFPEFKSWAGMLRPPMDSSTAWLAFSEMDVDHDLSLSSPEFYSGMLGKALAPTTTSSTATSTRTRTISSTRTSTATTTTTMALNVNLDTFSGSLQDSYGSVERAAEKLFKKSHHKVDFLAFAEFADDLWPPLNQTQAWWVFSSLDEDHDLSVKESEFLHAFHVAGIVVA